MSDGGTRLGIFRLAVINAASTVGAIVSNWDHPPIDAINAIWTKA
jgi:hypothetical protein